MEYFELGDLEKFITPELTEGDAKMFGRQLLRGSKFCMGITGLIAILNPEISLSLGMLRNGGSR